MLLTHAVTYFSDLDLNERCSVLRWTQHWMERYGLCEQGRSCCIRVNPPEWLIWGFLRTKKGQIHHAVGFQEKPLFYILMENLCEPANKSGHIKVVRTEGRSVLAVWRSLFSNEKEALFCCGATAKPKNQQFPGRQIKAGRGSFVNNSCSVVFIGRRC